MAKKLTLEEANEMWNKFYYKKSETEESETAEAKKAEANSDTHTGASSSTNRPKKAPKAPLPPGSADNPWGLH